MRIDQLKSIIKAVIKEARIYNRDVGSNIKTSTEYDLTPEEMTALKGMNTKQRQQFAAKKLHQARKEKGLCISCGKKSAVDKLDKTKGTYCTDCLQRFRDARNILTQKRNSCSRCPNPPLPGKKLCQKCTDELELLRTKALESGLCIRCKKAPMEPNKKGRQTLFCKKCNQIKTDMERQRKKNIKNWQGYGNDVISNIRAKKIANLRLQELK